MLEVSGAVLVAFFSGMIGAISGGGGLPTLSYLLFIGLPIDAAIATTRMSAIGVIAGSVWNFHKANKIDWQLFRLLAPIALLGGIIGGNLLVHIDKDLIQVFVGFVLLAILPTLYFKKNTGLKPIAKSGVSKFVGLLVFFLVAIFAGLIGPGSGFLFIIVLVQFFGLTAIKALATELAAFGIVVISSFMIFAFEGIVNYKYGFIFAVSGAIGSFVGSKLAIKKGNNFVKLMMVLVILATSAKLLIF